MKEITVFSPATIANISCGFDVLGCCLDTVGDVMVVRKIEKKGIYISTCEGYQTPVQVTQNVAGVAALAFYEAASPHCGFEIEIYKKIKPGSGIGSSSASASGSVFALNELLGKPYTKLQLAAFALKGEAIASGSEHADNIAPGIFGGFTLVKSHVPLEIIKLPNLPELFATIIHPQLELKTKEARSILPKEIPLQKAITQWSNVGSLVHALHTNNYTLFGNSLSDVIIEPYRSKLIPEFQTVKNACLKNGALGAGISGSGPSIFAFNKGIETAKKVELAMQEVYQKTGIDFYTFTSKINTEGIKILNSN